MPNKIFRGYDQDEDKKIFFFEVMLIASNAHSISVIQHDIMTLEIHEGFNNRKISYFKILSHNSTRHEISHKGNLIFAQKIVSYPYRHHCESKGGAKAFNS